MPTVLNAILAHQGPAHVLARLRFWQRLMPEAPVLLVHGGSYADFQALDFPSKVFVNDPALRTRDHQRQKQSYAAVWKAISGSLRDSPISHVFFAEEDHLPLIADLHARLLDQMRLERADVLGHHLNRIDGTSAPHYLYHASDPRFLSAWENVSVRTNKRVVLSMLGTGSFWTRESFEAVAEWNPPCPIYLELMLPTTAHHLGFRARDLHEQNAFVLNQPAELTRPATARARGAWTAHPVKELQPWDP